MAQNWQAPPASAVRGGSKTTKWGTVAQDLRDNPAKPGDEVTGWALVATKTARTAAVTLANGISAGRRPEFEPVGSFESAWAENGEGKFSVWARFVGDNAAPAPVEDDDDWDADEK